MVAETAVKSRFNAAAEKPAPKNLDALGSMNMMLRIGTDGHKRLAGILHLANPALLASGAEGIAMLRVYACLVLEHDWTMMLLAAAICLVSCVTAFHLAAQIDTMGARRGRGWLLLLAFVTGTGIWATHFVAMLAYRPGLPTVFLAGPTIGSILIAIAATFAAWSLLFSRKTGRVWGAGLAFAGGIAAMHYTGMAALQTTGRYSYDYHLVAASIIIGSLCSILAARLFAARRGRRLGAGCLLACAICAVHFGSMAAVSIRADPSVRLPPSSIDANLLTVFVAMGVVTLMAVMLATAIYEARIARATEDEKQRLKNFTQSALEGLVILDGETIVDANETFWCIAGYDPSRPPNGLAISDILPDHRARPKQALGPAFFEARLLGTDGAFVEVETAVRTVVIGGVALESIIVRDITERKAAAARIAHLASHDSLTGAGNRLSFIQALDGALRQASATAPIALLCLDLDRFKAVNDLHGHPAGDAVLIETARRIRGCLSEHEFLARLGGDEFAIVQQRDGQPSAAGSLAARIIEALGNEMRVGDLSIHLGSSIGIALFPSNAADADDLHKKADLALYRAKAEGRGTYRFFDSAMDQQLVQRRRLEADLRSAVQNGELHLHYQPIACLDSGQATGFEALLRWDHPILGSVSPSDFVPLAEESGLILEIGEFVLERACAEAVRWERQLKVAVNISPAQIAQGDIVDTVRCVLARTGLNADRLELEVTEGMLVSNPKKAVAALSALQALGIHIAMDDFGTGYSSLGYFRSFPFDQVKIDQSFVSGLTESSEALAIVKAIIGLGKGLGLAIVAEGVETPEQMRLLKAKGCHKAQGFLIGRPAPIENFQSLCSLGRDAAESDANAAVETDVHETGVSRPLHLV
jgi:diguanylate cyclase